MEEHQCKFCGALALYQLKNGQWYCQKAWRQCPAKRAEVSNRQLAEKNHRYHTIPWNKNLTKEDPRIAHATEKMRLTKLKYPAVAWNKGLTKEDDVRILEYSRKSAIAKQGKPNFKKRKPIAMNRNKCISLFRQRFKLGLYTHWIFPIMRRDQFCCTICKQSIKKLEVHHLISYRQIFDAALQKIGLQISTWQLWQESDIQKLHQSILDMHTLDIGITVCVTCHGKIDPYRQQFLKKTMEREHEDTKKFSG